MIEVLCYANIQYDAQQAKKNQLQIDKVLLFVLTTCTTLYRICAYNIKFIQLFPSEQQMLKVHLVI